MEEKISFVDGIYAELCTNDNLQSAFEKTDGKIKNLKEEVSKVTVATERLREKIFLTRLEYAEKFDEISHKNNVLTVMVVVQYIALALLALCK